MPLLKAHIRDYTRRDGVYVGAHEDSRRPSHVLPSSGELAPYQEAQVWWRTHLEGRTLDLVVHGKGGATTPIKVRFSNTNHAYTEDAGGKQKTGRRVFSAKRAHAMSRLLRVIEFPKARARDRGSDLLFEASVNGEHYTVVLAWMPTSKVYEFQSAHFRSIAEMRRVLERQDRQKNGGTLQKSDPLPMFAGLHDARRRGSLSGGYHPIAGAGNGRREAIMPTPPFLLKSRPPLTAEAPSLDLLRLSASARAVQHQWLTVAES